MDREDILNDLNLFKFIRLVLWPNMSILENVPCTLGKNVCSGVAGNNVLYIFLGLIGLNLFIYLFMAVLGLGCCVRAFSSCDERGLLFVAVRGLLIAVASLVVEHGL